MRGKKRPPEERVSNVAGPLPPCRVCGEQAAGFHYGVNTCEACKGFFRRSLLRNGNYECIGEGKCVIGTNRRKSCPKCRYLKCLEVGMSKEAIKTGRYTYMKRTQDTLEIKMLTNPQEGSSPDKGSTPSSLQSDLFDIPQALVKQDDGASLSQDDMSVESLYPDNLAYPDRCDNSHNIKAFERLSSVISESLENDEDTFKTSLESSLTPSPTMAAQALCSQLMDGLTETNLQQPTVDMQGTSLESRNTLKRQNMTALLPPPICSTMLSPQSAEENSAGSPVSNPWSLQGETSSSMLTSLSANHSPMSNISPLPSPRCTPSLQPKQEGFSLKDWPPQYSEEELEQYISIVVEAHKKHISDSNSLPEEFLMERVRECKERCRLQNEVFGPMGPIDKHDYDIIYNSTGIDVDGRMKDLSHCTEKMDADIQNMIAFFKLIPDFKHISLPDQTSLVKASIYELFMLAYFKGYNSDEYIVVEEFNSYCVHQLYNFYSEDLVQRIFKVTHQMQQLNLSFEAIVLMKTLCLFFPDRIELENYELISQLHNKAVQALRLLLFRNYPSNHNKMFSGIVSFLTTMRGYDDEFRKLWKHLGFEDYELVSSKPVLVELFSGNQGTL